MDMLTATDFTYPHWNEHLLLLSLHTHYTCHVLCITKCLYAWFPAISIYEFMMIL
jgi:hypothetical protein